MGRRKEKNRYTITPEEIIKGIKSGSPINSQMLEILNEDSLLTFIKDSIPYSILQQAELSRKNLVRDIYNLIVGVDKYVYMRERTLGNLAGVVGHVWATKYFKYKGYKVANEVELYNYCTGENLTSTDIILTDSKGRQTFIELKTAFKIGLDSDEIPVINFDNDVIDYLKPGNIIPRSRMQSVRKETLTEMATSTGNAAVKQLMVNKKYISDLHDGTDRKVALCVFSGVEIYPEARKKINEVGEIIELPLNIYHLYTYCFNLLGDLIYKGRNITKPPRGERSKEFEDRYDVNRIDLGL